MKKALIGKFYKTEELANKEAEYKNKLFKNKKMFVVVEYEKGFIVVSENQLEQGSLNYRELKKCEKHQVEYNSEEVEECPLCSQEKLHEERKKENEKHKKEWSSPQNLF